MILNKVLDTFLVNDTVAAKNELGENLVKTLKKFCTIARFEKKIK